MTGSDDWTRGEPILLGQRCTEGHTWYLPRARCPECASGVESFALSGAGTVFARTGLHRRVAAPSDGTAREGAEAHQGTAAGQGATVRERAAKEAIGIALVDLDEGVRIMARCAPETPIGSRVRVSIVRDAGTQRLMPQCEEVAA